MDVHITQRATHLLQRWRVNVYQLSYEYDEDGLHEMRHRELKRKLEVVRAFDPADLVKGGAKQDGMLTLKEDELIRKKPNGNFVMFKSNFDFLEKPMGYLESQEGVGLDMGFVADEESKRAEVRVQHKGQKGKHHRSAKNLITNVLVTHTRQAQAIKKPKMTFV